jgi:zinc protease
VYIKNFWDTPSMVAGQLIREHIYEGHPYHKNGLGTEKIVRSITQQQLIDLYKKFITPQGSKLAIVGDLDKYDLKKTLEEGLGTWHGPEVADICFPTLARKKAAQLSYEMNRDQVLLGMASLSISRKDADYDKLLIFDQIFSGGALGSMSSRLFDLREESGLFYSIRGSLISNADQQPGMVLVSTLVSRDRLDEAEKAIKNTLLTSVDTVTVEEFAEAKNAILNALVLNFEANGSIANAFLFIDRYNFPRDFFDTRANTLSRITLQDMQDAVKRVVDNDALAIVKVGRLKNK